MKKYRDEPQKIGCHARYQPARQEQLGVRCLAQGHFDNWTGNPPTARRQLYLLSHIAPRDDRDEPQKVMSKVKAKVWRKKGSAHDHQNILPPPCFTDEIVSWLDIHGCFWGGLTNLYWWCNSWCKMHSFLGKIFACANWVFWSCELRV